MANVIFKIGTRAQYDALAIKDENTLYWLSDTQELIKGLTLFGKGVEATKDAAGLLSAEDKKRLDELVAGGILNIVPIDASVIISKAEDGNTTIGIRLSKVEGNLLSLNEDGLFVKIDSIPIAKVEGLEKQLRAIEDTLTWQDI